MKTSSFCVLSLLLAFPAAQSLAAPAEGPAKGVTVSVASTWSASSPTAGIQEAVDALPPEGGIVFIPAGTYEIVRRIVLRSGVWVRGEGEHTVIAKRRPSVQTLLAEPARTGERKITVKDPSGFNQGDEILVRSSGSTGWWSAHPIVLSIQGNVLQLDTPLEHNYLPSGDAVAANFHPTFYATEQRDIRIEDLVIDGRVTKGQNYVVEFTTDAIHFRDVRDALVATVHVKNYTADGIGVQMGDNVRVTGCLCEHNIGHGFHPGTSITSSTWTENVGRFNGWDGLYFCHNVRHSIMSGNRFHDNGWNGIGGLGDNGDRYDVITGNFCYNNAKCGIQCVDGGNNIITANVCENNSREEPGKWPGILLSNFHSSVISNNRCFDFRPDSAKTQSYGIEVIGNSRDNVITSNLVSGNLKGGLFIAPDLENTVADNLKLKSHASPDK